MTDLSRYPPLQGGGAGGEDEDGVHVLPPARVIMWGNKSSTCEAAVMSELSHRANAQQIYELTQKKQKSQTFSVFSHLICSKLI